ncbi:hexitol phosphatase HxpB [Flavobacterium psychrophilum]|uniref:hexitol phosphatase HxpB n=1 Tax=Flavobacterium psychrophilum TaxID=96345 RepID=UPI001FC9A3E2|nr:hexitol phosphatase HxpB [Flavobacterium psychrophilum]
MQKAVIFDMDGVIIDSENLWEKAEKEVFTALGVNVTYELSELTKSMTTIEATKFWFDKFPWQEKSIDIVEQMVISRVVELIDKEDCKIKGVKEFIERLKAKNYKIGLATNSPNKIIPKVLQKLDIQHLFDTVSSAEFEENGKPSPSIYLTTAVKLNVTANNCIAIEDSYSGMLAAKSAGMTVIAFTNGKKKKNFGIEDYIIDNFEDFNTDIFN